MNNFKMSIEILKVKTNLLVQQETCEQTPNKNDQAKNNWTNLTLPKTNII